MALTLLSVTLGAATAAAVRGFRDPLTGLRNRRGLLKLIESSLRRTRGRRDRGSCGSSALIVLDLDGFRALNDSLGASAGDHVLKETAQRLNLWLSGTATSRCGLRARLRGAAARGVVARLGGDEFAVFLLHVAGTQALEQEVHTLLDELALPYSHGAWPALALEAYAGVSYYPDHAESADELLSRADVALRHAQVRRSGFEIYDSERDAVHSAERLQLLTELRRALQTKELRLHYQPIVDFTGRTLALEALLRWDCPARGRVPPDEFVPLAESSSLAPHLTGYVLDTALRQARFWRQRGIQVPVAVNVSTRDIAQEGFATEILAALAHYGLPAQALELEITERLMVEDRRLAVEALDRLRREGIKVSLDDFGTGYSSMARLRSLPIDTIKLDHRFVARLDADEDDAAIVRCSVELARLLGMRVVAEGVESRSTWQQLHAMGVDGIQGWFISAALPPDRIPSWLQGHQPADTRFAPRRGSGTSVPVVHAAAAQFLVAQAVRTQIGGRPEPDR